MIKGQTIWVVAAVSDAPLIAKFIRWRDGRVIYSCSSRREYSAQGTSVFLERNRAFDVAIHRLQASCIERVAKVESTR